MLLIKIGAEKKDAMLFNRHKRLNSILFTLDQRHTCVSVGPFKKEIQKSFHIIRLQTGADAEAEADEYILIVCLHIIKSRNLLPNTPLFHL